MLVHHYSLCISQKNIISQLDSQPTANLPNVAIDIFDVPGFNFAYINKVDKNQIYEFNDEKITTDDLYEKFANIGLPQDKNQLQLVINCST